MTRVNTFSLLLISLCMSWLWGPSLQAQTTRITRSYFLTDADSLLPHAFWLKGLPNSAGSRRYQWVAPATFFSFSDRTTTIKGEIVNVTQPNTKWDVEIKLVRELRFSDWVLQGGEAYIGDVDSAFVFANQQNWRFWEFDSLHSFLIGPPGSTFAGDTLFLAHRPTHRLHGFQFGQGANSKDKAFGLSGWFYFTGAYTGHGDIVANAACAPRPCNLDVSATTVCTSDSTFAIVVQIDSSTHKVTLQDDQGTAIRTKLSPGTYTYGSYANGTVVSIYLNDTQSTNCDTTISGLTNICKSCDLQVTSTTTHCFRSDSFDISITFTGTGHNFKIEDGLGTCFKNIPAGTYTIGPYASGTTVPVKVIDRDLTGCDTSFQVSRTCKTCDLQLLSITTPCVSIDSFDVIVSFSGTGSNFKIDDGFGFRLRALSAGTHNLGTYANGTNVRVKVADQDLACCDTTVTVTEDCLPPCDLFVSHLVPQCLNDSTFTLQITLQGTGVYQVSDNQGNISSPSLSSGTYTFGQYPNGTIVNLTVSDLLLSGCDTTINHLTQDCTPPCDLLLTNAVATCINDSTFEVSVSFTGTGSSYTLSDNQGNTQTGLSAGTYVVGTYTHNTLVSVSVNDTRNSACDTTVTGLTQDCTPPCDLLLTNAVATCINDSTFEVSVSFTGTGSSYTLSDNQGNTQTGLSAGTYVVGTYANNTLVSVSVNDTRNSACDTTATGLTQDCTPPCDLLLTNAVATCINDSTFEVSVSFTGTGSSYTLSDNQGNTQAGLSAGTYVVGTYANNTLVSVSVNDTRNSACDTTVTGLTQDCTPPCDLLLTNAVATCINDSTFEVSVSFTGTGSSYTLSDNQGNTQTGLSAGTYLVGTYANNTLVSVSVNDTRNSACDTTVTGLTQDCTPPCDLLLTNAVATCINDSTFEVSVSFTGTGSSYTLSDNQGNTQTGLSAGTYVVGTYANNTVVSVTVNDTRNSACDTTVTGLTQDCTPPCDLIVIHSGPQCLDDTTFAVLVNIQGSGTYTITDDQGTTALAGLTSGSYVYGLYSTGTFVSVTVSDQNLVGCDTTISQLTQNCTPPCDLLLTNAVATCINDSTFEVSVSFTGTGSSYTLSDNQGNTQTGLSAGTYVIGTYANNTLVSVTVNDTRNSACDTTVTGLTQDCTPPCDLLLTNAVATCINDSTFEVSVSFTGTGSSYTLSDNQGNTQTGLSAGTYVVGTYTHNTLVSVSVNDTRNSACDTTVTGLTQDCTPPCDLLLTNAVATCINDSTFEVSVSFTGTGSSYTLSDNQGNTQAGLSAGTYVVGTYANNTLVSVSVNDTRNSACDTTATGLTQDCTPPCDLLLTNAVATCINDSTFEVSVSFTGTGSSYTLSDNQGNTQAGLSAGTYVVGTYANNTLVSVSVNDTRNSACDTTVTGLTQDCTPPCDLLLTSAVATCINDSTFEVSVSFTGTGSSYTLSDNQGNTQTGLSAGTYVVGTYANNTLVSVTVDDTRNSACDTTVTGLTQDCAPPPCNLLVSKAETRCVSDSTFEIDVIFAGVGNAHRIADNFGNVQSNLSSGSYVLGPYLNNTVVSVTVSDTSLSACDTTLTSLTADCTPIVCDLSIISLTPVCINNDSFVVELLFTGGGDDYRIIDIADFIPRDTIFSDSSGLIILGPYLSSTNVDVIVTDLRLPNCTVSLGPVSADCTAPLNCDLAVDSIYTTCVGDSFDVIVLFSGSGGANYALFDNLGIAALTNLSPDTTVVGRYPSGASVGVIISDTRIIGCLASAGPITDTCATAAIAPANDNIRGAILLPCNDAISGTLTGATAIDAPPACRGINPSGATGVWYTISGVEKLFTLSSCHPTLTKGLQVTVYTGTPDNLSCIGGTNQSPSCGTGGFEFSFRTNASRAYYIYISQSGMPVDEFLLEVNCTSIVISEPSLGLSLRPNLINLDWSLEMEYNSDGFVVERQLPGGTFTDLQYVPSKGTSPDKVLYAFEDYDVLPYQLYTYRIRQELSDGSLQFSNTVSGKIINDDLTIGMPYPNPARTSFYIDLILPEATELSYAIVDAKGRYLQSRIVHMESGKQTLEIQANWLISGVYLVHLTIDGHKTTRKMIIRR